MNQQSPIPIRMSSAGYCPRRQAYAALGEPPSNLPTRHDENRMALGDAAEDILVNNMLRDGWEVTDTRSVPGGEQLELEIDFPLPMTGHPDGICRHPEHTRNLWVTLECKSMFEDRLFRVKHEGITQVYPEYLAQTMTYSRILYESGRVAHPHRAVFAVMDRDGEQLPPERVAWDTSAEDRLWQDLTTTWSAITRGELPPRPYEPDHEKCRYCPYFSVCHNQNPPDWRNPSRLEDQATLDAARQWLEADRLRRDAAQHLRAAAQGHESGIIAGPVRASFFHPRPTTGYDSNLLEQRVPADILRECRNTRQDPPAFWIRPDRR